MNDPVLAAELPLRDALRQIEIFSDLSAEQIDWFVSKAEELHVKQGDILIREGDPADRLVILLSGELRGQKESAGPDAPVYIARAGQVTGMLPFSRLTTFGIVSRAVVPSRIVLLHKNHFQEMLRLIPEMGERLVGVLSDRIRETTRSDNQRDKLMALGKLSAGLAHELNNPAAAARRSASSLREAVDKLRGANCQLDERSLAPEQRTLLLRTEREARERLKSVGTLDPMTRSDREDDISAWLDSHHISQTYSLAASLVEHGLESQQLAEFAAGFGDQALGEAVQRIDAALHVDKLIEDIEESSTRISTLVRAVKEYSYMDQASQTELDIHEGIESTLTMLNHGLKYGITVVREFDRTLPRILAHGSELNQVWTNLIDNAIDAMKGKGELRIRTSRELENVLVRITDNGPGMPPEVQSRVFEPFFTTKPVGEGTGLGLDTVHRIVRNHHGDVRVESKPGETTFEVRLPFEQVQ